MLKPDVTRCDVSCGPGNLLLMNYDLVGESAETLNVNCDPKGESAESP